MPRARPWRISSPAGPVRPCRGQPEGWPSAGFDARAPLTTLRDVQVGDSRQLVAPDRLIRCAQSRLGKHAGSCADRLVLYARGSAGGRSSSRQNRVLGRHISSVESWDWTPDVPVRSGGLRQRACRAELVALWGLHDGPGARVHEGIRVRAGPRASASAVASANRPGGHPAATSTSAFRQIVVSPVRCRGGGRGL